MNRISVHAGQPSVTADTILVSGTVDLGNSSGNSLLGRDDDISIRSEGGSGHNYVTLGDGTDDVHLSGRGNVVVLGNGNDTVSAGSANNSISLGSGTNLVFLGLRDSLYTEGFGIVDASAGGSDLITTSATASVSILLHDAHNVVVTNGASDVIADSAIGHDTFYLHGGGHVTFSSFATTSQVVLGVNDGFSSAADAAAAVQNTAAGAVLNFGSGGSAGQIVFVGIPDYGLHASNFAIGGVS